MSMIIANNIQAINTQRQFGISARGMSSSMEKLSSGYKINTGKDDPSGLTISEQLRSQINGLKRAQTNTEEAINVMSIAEGAMNEMSSILKKMKALAIHANNNGVTSPDQVAADQAEMDSALQTLDRIAQTTKFADQQLINGNKDLSYEQDTAVMGTQQNKLISMNDSTFSQIFKRDMQVSISFNGGKGNIAADTAFGVTGTKMTDDGKEVNFANQAQKAYFEVDSNKAIAGSDLGSNGKFLHAQKFTLTGNKGSRSFNIAKGATVGELVKQINTASDATGVKAALVFNSEQKVAKLDTPLADLTIARTSGMAHVFNNDLIDANGDALKVIDAITDIPGTVAGDAIQFGRNTDGQGNMYIKFIDHKTAEIYKDASMSKESLVGVATNAAAEAAPGTWTVKGSNNSGLDGLEFTTAAGFSKEQLAAHKGAYINFGGIEGEFDDGSGGDINVAYSGNLFYETTNGTATAVNFLQGDVNLFTGVELGKNTSEEGKIFIKMVVDDQGDRQVFAYNHESMEDKYLVAKSEKDDGTAQQVTLNEIRNDDQTAGTGLGIVLGTTAGATAPTDEGVYTGSVQFTNVGARIYADEYGADQYVKIQQESGQAFSYYETQGSTNNPKLLEAGTTRKNNGQDATLSVNGSQVKTTGLELNMANQDFQASFSFNEGKVGSTTIAQVGYDTGSVFTKIGALNLGSNEHDAYDGGNNENLSAYLCNAGHSTTEKLGGFDGGMQLQLGESASSNDRTVVAAKSMTTENLGKVTRQGYYDSEAPTVLSEKTFTLKDCFGGRQASLSVNADLAMDIIDVAIQDVAGQRATLGAMQSNLLQTNSNNLAVTIENIQKTESGIRDADMATEMADFTKNQVLQNAAMTMMSQANQNAQSALQLLR